MLALRLGMCVPTWVVRILVFTEQICCENVLIEVLRIRQLAFTIDRNTVCIILELHTVRFRPISVYYDYAS